MGIGHLRRYDVQANYAFGLSLASVIPFVVAAWLAFTRYDGTLGQIIHGEQGQFVPAFAGCVLLSMIPGTLGFLLGWNSAGQRRNDKPGRSWIGFFLGGGVLTLDLVLLLAFFMLRLERPA